jgi:hypothetical protein
MNDSDNLVAVESPSYFLHVKEPDFESFQLKLMEIADRKYNPKMKFNEEELGNVADKLIKKTCQALGIRFYKNKDNPLEAEKREEEAKELAEWNRSFGH